MLLALRRVSLACREGGGLRKPEEPASKTRSARILSIRSSAVHVLALKLLCRWPCTTPTKETTSAADLIESPLQSADEAPAPILAVA